MKRNSKFKKWLGEIYLLSGISDKELESLYAFFQAKYTPQDAIELGRSMSKKAKKK